MRTPTILGIFLFMASAVFPAETSSLTNALNFFIVSDMPITGGRYIDTPEFPKLGYIADAPNMVVTKLSSVTTNSSTFMERYHGKEKKSIETVFLIAMEPADAKKFTKLTRENLGHQALILLGKRPLVAPFIQEPIDTPALSIRPGSRADLSSLERDLKALIKHE